MGTNTPNPSRRSLLAALPAVALAAAPTPIASAAAGYGRDDRTPQPDARLIALCNSFIRSEDEYDALSEPYYTTDDKMPSVERERVEELVDRHHRIRALVVRIPARTLAGLRAKAAMMERDLRSACLMPECVNPDEELLPYYDLARDVLALLRDPVAMGEVR